MDKIIKEFVKFVSQKLRMNEVPKIKVERDPNFSTSNKTFGIYYPDDRAFTVEVYGRNIVDVLRTIAHEMTHHRQNEVGSISTKDRADLEIEATIAAGMLVKIFCESRPELYGLKDLD